MYALHCGFDLNVITSAVHADTLAVVASELVDEASAQLELDAEDSNMKGMCSFPFGSFLAGIG